MNNVNKDTLAAFTDFTSQQSAELRNGGTAQPLGVDEALAEGGRLKDKVVVVTGAGSGFGKAFSLAAARFGCVPVFLSGCCSLRLLTLSSYDSAKLVLGDVNAKAVEGVVEEIKAAGG